MKLFVVTNVSGDVSGDDIKEVLKNYDEFTKKFTLNRTKILLVGSMQNAIKECVDLCDTEEELDTLTKRFGEFVSKWADSLDE